MNISYFSKRKFLDTNKKAEPSQFQDTLFKPKSQDQHIGFNIEKKANRIKHTYTSEKKESPISQDKWQNALEGYVQNKQKLSSFRRSLNTDSDFPFLKLSRINQYRKKRMLINNSVRTLLERQRSFDESLSTSHSISKAAQLQSRLQELPQNQKKAEPVARQERILNQFVKNYFKSKYRKCTDLNEDDEPRQIIRKKQFRLKTQKVHSK